MASRDQSAILKQTLIDITNEYKRLTTEAKMFATQVGATSGEIQKLQGSALAALNKRAQEYINKVSEYNSKNSELAKTNEDVAKTVGVLGGKIVLLEKSQLAYADAVGSVVKKENDLRELQRKQAEADDKKLAREQELARVARRRQEDEAKAQATANAKTSREQQYVDQANNLNTLNAKMREYAANIDALVKKGKTNSEIAKLTETEYRKLEQQYVKNIQKTKNQIQNLTSSNKNTQENAELVKKLTTNLDKLRQSMSVLQSTYGKATAEKGFVSGLKSVLNADQIGKAAGRLLTYAGVLGGVGAAFQFVKKVLVDSVKSFIDFEDKIGRLSAITGATGESLKSMENEIRRVAVTTRFTAGETADLAVSLAKLGATSSEVKSLLEPVAIAAQAMGTGLSETGEAILKVNNQFGFGASESAKTARILTDAVNSSALSLQSFSTAIQYVGPVARSAGASFESTAASMRLLADNGITASRIGTGLRKVFLELAANGENYIDVLKQLNSQNISLAKAEELVGKTAAGQLLILAQNVDAIEILSDKTYSYYSTLVATSAQMSTSAAQIDILKSAFDEFKLSIGAVIQDSETFLSIIGFFSQSTKELARSYKIINQAQANNNVELRKSIDTVVDGTVSQAQTAFKILELSGSTVAKANSDAFKRVSEAAKISEQDLLSLIGYANEFDVALGSFDFQRMLAGSAGVGADLDRANYWMKELSKTTNDEFIEGLIGVNSQMTKIVYQEKELRKAQAIRTSVQSKYSGELNEILKKEKTNSDAIARAGKLSVKIQKELSGYYEANLKMQAGLVAMDEEAYAQNELRVSALQNQLNLLAPYVSQIEEDEEKRRRELEKAINTAFNKEKKRIQEDIEARKQQIAQQKELYELRIANAAQDGNAEEALRLSIELTKLETDANEEFSASISEFENRWKQAYVTIDGKRLKNVLDTDTLINGVDQLTDSIAQLALTPDDLKDWMKSVQSSITSVLQDSGTEAAKEAADAILSEYLKRLKESGVSQEIIDLFQSIFTLTIYPRIDDAAVKEAEKIQKDLQDRSDADSKAIDAQRIKNLEAFAKELKKFLTDAAELTSEIYNQQQDAALEALKARLEQEKALISERAEYEEKLLDAQIENQLISQEEYAARLAAIKRKEIQGQNQIDKKIFESEKKRDAEKARIDFLEALASIIPNLIIKEGRADPATLALMTVATTLLASASYASEMRALNQRKFYPKKFAEGGLVYGPSHANGGVPFTVNGRGGYEMEGGEYIVNKYSTKRYKSVLDKINGTQTSSYSFAKGGIVTGQEATQKQLEYLEAIAEATVNTAINVSKPVRAFVSSDDISRDETARRIKERNRNL
jgi:hypothetical protein